MAKASTIDVVVRGEYQDKDIQRALRDIKKLQATSIGMGQRIQNVGKQMQDFGKQVSHVGGSLTKGMTLPILAGGAAIIAFAKGAEDAEIANRKLGAVLDSMGYPEATKRVSDYAESLERSLAVDADVIKATQTKLATFKNLTATVGEADGAFDRATMAALDLAAAGFGSAEQNAVQLGKALQDPVKGITALGRAGVTFTEQEKEKIKALVESGDLLGAQNLVLQALESQVGGTAEAGASSFDKIKLSLMQIADAIGMAVLPLINQLSDFISNTLVPTVVPKIDEFVAAFTNLDPGIKKSILAFIGFAAAIGPVLLIVGKVITIVGGAIKIIGLLVGAFNPVTLVIAAVIAAIVLFVLAIRHLWNNSADFRDAVMRIWEMIQAAITRVIDLVKQKLEENADTIDMLREAFAKAVEFITTYVVPVIVKFYEHYLTLLIEGIVLVISFIVEFIAAFVRLIAKFIEVGTTVATFVADAVAWFGKLRDGIATALGSVQTTVSSVWNGILSTITGVLNRVKGVVRDAINFIIRGWNRLSFSVPSVDLGPLGKVGGFTIGVQTITELAAGGIVTRPTLALVGEAGPEAVLPLTGRNAAAAGIGQSATTINLTVNAGIGTDGAEVGRQVVDAITAYERRNGSVYVAA